MRMLHYDIEIKWVKGRDMHLADMLSRAYLPEVTGSTEFSEVNLVESLSMNEDNIKRLQAHTRKDETLQTVTTVIQRGWPERKSDVPQAAHPYFNLKDELSIQD